MKIKEDKIRFEYRSEVLSILMALEEWEEKHKKNNDEMNYDVRQLINFLNDLYLYW